MKFLKIDILHKALNPAEKRIEHNEDLWEQRLIEYWKVFNSFKDRLSNSFVDYYTKTALHDDYIQKIEIINMDDNDIKSKTNIVVTFRSYHDDKVYSITYKNVRKYKLTTKASIGSYLVGEILEKGKALTHEFITSNKCSCYVEFNELVYEEH